MSPSVVALAGPNGAGKSTAGHALLKETLGITEFVNADVIARGLSAFDPERAAIAAGRVLLRRIRELADRRESFAFETTLASRSFAPWLAGLATQEYVFHLVFLWLPSADIAVRRVQARVQAGGHAVPEITVRRRCESGLRNFFDLYRPIARTWRLYDNSSESPRLIAGGAGARATRVPDKALWRRIEESHGGPKA